MRRKSWWLDEAAHAGPEHLDAAFVASYERKAGYDPTEDVDALRRLGLRAESTLVDLGAGTGALALAAAPHCREVTAVDVSPAMVAALRERVRASGAGNVRVVEAGFLSYEPAGPPVDFAFARNALHQLPDFWKGVALARIFALLRPGGVLRVKDLVFDFEPRSAAAQAEDWVQGAIVTDPREGYTAEDLAEHVRTEHSTYAFLFEALLEHAGFAILERDVRRKAYATYTCRRP